MNFEKYSEAVDRHMQMKSGKYLVHTYIYDTCRKTIFDLKRSGPNYRKTVVTTVSKRAGNVSPKIFIYLFIYLFIYVIDNWMLTNNLKLNHDKTELSPSASLRVCPDWWSPDYSDIFSFNIYGTSTSLCIVKLGTLSK